MVRIRAAFLALCMFVAVGCGAAPVAEQNVASVQPSRAPVAPTVPATAQAATAQAETAVLQPTVLPPTQAPTQTLAATTAPTAQPTALAPTAAPVPTQPAPTTAISSPTVAPATAKSEILFLRQNVLIALDPATSTERTIVDNVADFTAAANGSLIALVRGSGAATNIWLIQRDGTNLVQLTNDVSADAVPSLAPDGSAIVWASANINKPYSRMWPDWGAWCAASEVQLIELATNQQRSLGAGCDPAFGPDGKRIAFATPPTGAVEPFPHSTANTIRMVNRQNQNGWNLATADGGIGGEEGKSGLLVYAPAWSPDGEWLVYHRFLGYQALVDLGMSELSVAFRADGKPLYSGAGWQLPARFAPNGKQVAITEDNYSDARGFGGYDNWSVTVVPLEGTRSERVPDREVTMIGAKAETLRRAQNGAWSPDGSQLAVVLPSNWKPDLPLNQPVNNGEAAPGELWLWTPGSNPQQRIATNVDFASPVVWLP